MMDFPVDISFIQMLIVLLCKYRMRDIKEREKFFSFFNITYDLIPNRHHYRLILKKRKSINCFLSLCTSDGFLSSNDPNVLFDQMLLIVFVDSIELSEHLPSNFFSTTCSSSNDYLLNRFLPTSDVLFNY